MQNTLEHKTVVVKKNFKSPVNDVYKAFASVKARSVWSVPKGDAIKYLQSEFKKGGIDIFKCGSFDSMDFKGVVTYHEILKNKRIISTEMISHKKRNLSVALVSIELVEINSSTKVTITAQIASLDGADMSRGYKQGWTSTLKNLEEYLNE